MKCRIPARTLPPCDLPWGHANRRHANGGNSFFAAEFDEEHEVRQELRIAYETQQPLEMLVGPVQRLLGK